MVTDSKCASCHAPVIWAFTEQGRRMPVDRDPVEDGNLLLVRRGTRTEVVVRQKGAGLHRPHFATCPHALEWRR